MPRNPPNTHQLGEGPQRPQSSIAHVNLGPSAQTYVVTDRVTTSSTPRAQTSQGLNPSASNDSNISQQDAEDINISVNPANNNNINDNAEDSQSDDGTQQVKAN